MLRFIWNALGWLQKTIMVVTAIVLVCLVTAQVLLRYLFKMPLMGVEELACMVGIWMYMMGAAYGARDRSHIRADLLHLLIKEPRSYAWAKGVIAFVTAVLAGVMCKWCWDYVLWSIKSWERSPALMIPMVYTQASLLASSFLMTFYFLVESLDNFRIGAGKAPFAFIKESGE